MPHFKLFEEIEEDGFSADGTGLTPEQRSFLVNCVKKGKFLKRGWKIDSEGRVDVKGNVIIDPVKFPGLEKIPLQFGNVQGRFSCEGVRSLKTLEGAPVSTEGDFSCKSCYGLISLKGSPVLVLGDFYCSNCKNLTSLKGAPKKVTGNFWTGHCPKLESLIGAPVAVFKTFDCMGCSLLSSIDGMSKGVKVFVNLGTKIPKEQLTIVRDKKLLQKWQESGMPIEEFLTRKRGFIRGKKFGL